MVKYVLMLLFGASILTPLAGTYAMLLAYFFVALISYKNLAALAMIIYSAYKIKVLSKNGKD
jgi:hypothetical protein